jgi:hypothetical protein
MGWGAALGRTTLCAAIAACAAAFAGYLVFAATNAYTSKSNAATFDPLAVADLKGRQVFTLLLSWAPALVASVLTLTLRVWFPLHCDESKPQPGMLQRVGAGEGCREGPRQRCRWRAW